MGYVVIKSFIDRDNHHVYHVGDSFPRHGEKVSSNRLQELMSIDNQLKTPLVIYKEDTEKPRETHSVVETDEKPSNTEEVKEKPQEKPRRGNSKKNVNRDMSRD